MFALGWLGTIRVLGEACVSETDEMRHLLFLVEMPTINIHLFVAKVSELALCLE